MVNEKKEFETRVADCVTRSHSEVVVHEMRERPDADLLHTGGFRVGLEIVQTVDEHTQSAIDIMRTLSRALELKLATAGISVHVNIYFDWDEIGRPENRRAWKRSLPELLSVFIGSASGVANVEQLKAAGIERVAHVEVLEAERTIVWEGWWSHARKGKTLAEIVLAKKDHKLPGYRRENRGHFSQYWLAIAGIGPGTVEDGGFLGLLKRRYQTAYDRVFLIFFDEHRHPVEACDVTPLE